MLTEPEAEAGPLRYKARWYLWDGGFLAMGRVKYVVPPHSHHAIQITVGLDGQSGMRGPDGVLRMYDGMVTAADVTHELHQLGAMVAILLVDPESKEGRWLRRSYRDDITPIPDPKHATTVEALRAFLDDPGDEVQSAQRLHAIVRGLCAGPAPATSIDPRVADAIAAVRKMDVTKISLEAAAAAVFLSPSRFAHLFSAETGLPFRRFLLWRRLTRAMLAVGRGATLTAAAHSSGFTDSAHLTRACYQMLGTPPSVLLQAGEFYEIPAPFQVIGIRE